MGMFDNLRCLYQLPEGAPTEGYQTGDTEAQCLDLYEITEDGRLRRQTYRIEDHSDPDLPGLMALAGMMTRIPEGWEDVAFHGALTFYTHDDDGKWWEFTALYDRGTLLKIEQAPPEPPC